MEIFGIRYGVPYNFKIVHWKKYAGMMRNPPLGPSYIFYEYKKTLIQIIHISKTC